MSGGEAASNGDDLERTEGLALLEVLETLSATESKIAEEIYPRFFGRRPDAQPLFGVHAVAEREEMIRETLRSLLALAEDGPHLAANLVALGRSHFEYGVAGDMYDDFVEAFVEVAGPGLADEAREVLRRGLASITDAMRRAGDDAARELAERRGGRP